MLAGQPVFAFCGIASPRKFFATLQEAGAVLAGRESFADHYPYDECDMRALLDQALISGVGNIYADEALWRSRLHYAAPTDSLTRARVVELIGHATDVMVAALDQGGTSFDALYVNVNGESGYFDRSLDAYGRNGIGCRRCGTAMIREPWANRSSYRCPRCQRRPRSPLP
jgi:formamidopyrimidine-DNA glycosylase